MEQEPIRVLVVASYPAVRAGLRAMLDGYEGIELVGDAPLMALQASQPEADVVVVEVDRDSEGVVDSLDDAPELPVVMLAGEAEVYHEFSFADGRAAAYLLRTADADDIAAAVRAVARGLVVADPTIGLRGSRPRPPAVDSGISQLTERELDVLRLLAAGLPNKGIALELGISEHTVKFHVGSILSRLNAASRTEAVMLAARRGLLPL